MSLTPEQAKPSPLLAPDRVVEHVLHSLSALPLEDAVEQAFVFSGLGAAGAPPVESPAQQRYGWGGLARGPLDRDGFRAMLEDQYEVLLGQPWGPLRHLQQPAWAEDDRQVSFLVALGDVEGDEHPGFGRAVSVTLRRPGQGSHRDCWLVDSVALRAATVAASDSAVGKATGALSAGEAEHNDYQESVFDEKADMFAAPGATPPAVVPRMHRVARACQLDARTTVLDVATGTGALLPFFAAEGGELGRVTGVDLSDGMLRHARQRFPAASFVKSDILAFTGPAGERFGRVVYNACFGNFWDQGVVLKHTSADLVADGGLVVISHPLGRRWLERLREKDPRMVRHPLPTRAELERLVQEYAPRLSVVSVDDEDDFYCAVLRQSPAE